MSPGIKVSRKHYLDQTKSEDDEHDERPTKLPRHQDISSDNETEATLLQASQSIDPLVNGDTATIIYSFLDCRELLNMACTSKLLMERVSYEHVLRSSMMHGGYAKSSTERIVSLVQQNKIHVPSPMRMLRIANGRRCENCLRDKVNVLSADYGVFFGRRCCLNENKWSRTVPHNSQWSAILSEPKMARSDTNTRTQVFDRPFFKFGESHGPVLTAKCWLQDCKQQEGAVVELLHHYEAHEVNCFRAKQLVRAYDEALGDATRRTAERETAQSKRQELSWTKFVNKSQAVVQRLEHALGRMPERDVLLKWTPPRREEDGKRRIQGQFGCPLLNEYMKKHFKAPSKFKGAKVTEAATKCFQVVAAATALMQLDFLSQADPCESMLLQYCKSQDQAVLQNTFLNKMDAATLKAIQQGHLLAAMEMLLPVDAIAHEAIADASTATTISTDSLSMQKSLAKLSWSASITLPPTRECYQSALEQYSFLSDAVNEVMATPDIKVHSRLNSFLTRNAARGCGFSMLREHATNPDCLSPAMGTMCQMPDDGTHRKPSKPLLRV
ncbi:hypothetical protein MPSEU_000170500 [Mayamaea pseudoterrestris]|nr:hypothetical protein MPSEU_000170500 [Mayamaea pseudoterrestris]